uniref:EF-hand domain-containing protein n=1 Tax=Macrostomum lignano TaxID=282301 RepID=A0A1I8GVK9_9PLAT
MESAMPEEEKQAPLEASGEGSKPEAEAEESTEVEAVQKEQQIRKSIKKPQAVGAVLSPEEDQEFAFDDIADDNGYDTDLEEKTEHAAYDHSGRTLYIDLCKSAGVVPASYYLRHIADSELDMRHHGLGTGGIKPLCASLASNSTVTKLDLGDNWLGAAGGLQVVHMLRENCFITELNLADNKMGLDVAKQLCEVLMANTQVTSVCLRGNEFDDRSSQFFADLITNNFAELGGFTIGKALMENSSLLELNLSWNHIRAKGAKGVAEGLAANNGLKVLDLSFNGFGPTYGLQELSKAIKVNTCLEELNLSNNRITTEGAVLFGKGLTLNSTLKVLRDIMVNDDFKDLHYQLLETMPELKVEVGVKVPHREKAKVHPMMKLRNFVEKRGMKMIDFFNTFDKDRSMSVTREEFLEGLEESGLNLTDEEVEWLINDLDKDGDGEINYSEMVAGHAEFSELEKKALAMNSVSM